MAETTWPEKSDLSPGYGDSPTWGQVYSGHVEMLIAAQELPGAVPPAALTIASGSITPATAAVIVDTESAAAADDLSTINGTTLHDGAFLFLRAADASRVVTVKHGTGVGAIQLHDAADVALSATSWLQLRRSGTGWMEVQPLRAASAQGCTGNAATATRADTLKQGGLAAPTSAGTSTAYTVTSSPVVSALAAGNIYQFKAHTACGASPTVNFDGLGAKTLKKFSGGSKANLSAGDIPSGSLVQCLYDGTDMVVSSVAGAATGSYDSGNLSVTGSGQLTLPHGLGVTPSEINTFIKCTSAHVGYAVGDEVRMPPNSVYSTTDGFSMWADATNIYIQFASGGAFTIVRRVANFDAATVTSANWVLVVRAKA